MYPHEETPPTLVDICVWIACAVLAVVIAAIKEPRQ